MAYDPTTGQIFVISYLKKVIVEGALSKFVPAISTIDPVTAMVTPIAETPQMAAIAINQAGELYGVSMGADSKLYRINKTSGECTEIGRQDLSPTMCTPPHLTRSPIRCTGQPRSPTSRQASMR